MLNFEFLILNQIQNPKFIIQNRPAGLLHDTLKL
jgi:hypothetical protein